jgi:hypothetical protein
MEDPQAWTSIAEQYAPYEDDLDIEDENEDDVNGLAEDDGIPDYGYNYPEVTL